ncbi:phospholipase D-like domain-containing protein [Novipirellula artificiosorum]|uniref:Major cardiolipin synthase ClsA n=1 Tax=Novipirellula artificiosorum TaxID=2528016 RepID=A0A5C6D8L8_9BACT|nr:phosphatidylserine/phosphatidylglycerophosphate/cardiolipin synthase family protein [Novipirellula artificiosorum]TWU31199.1 Major cardiolipin synthase ClsA [Novipirellula artificiosorum]
MSIPWDDCVRWQEGLYQVRSVFTVLRLRAFVERPVPFVSWAAIGWFVVLAFNSHNDTHANHFSILSEDQAALRARVTLAENAEHEINVISFAVDGSDVPVGLLALLRQASTRGVRVRVLIDGLNLRLPSGFVKRLVEDGVEIRVFHPPFHAHPLWWNRRLHDKLFLVDRKAMVIGSRNLRDTHFGREETNFIDCDFMMAGEICNSATDYFDQLWRSPEVRCATEANTIGSDQKRDLKMGVVPWITSEAERSATYLQAMQVSMNRIGCDGSSAACDSCGCPTTSLTEVSACLVRDATGQPSNRKLQRLLCAMIDSADSSIDIESPYPIFTPETLDAIRRATDRGVKVTLLTNSLQSTDQVLVYAGYQRDKKKLLDMKVNLFEYIGQGHLHVKTVVVDQRDVLFGSSNFDSRGERFNHELCVFVSDSRVASMLKPLMNQRLEHARSVQDGSLFPEVIGDASLQRRFQMRTLQAVVPLLRHLL